MSPLEKALRDWGEHPHLERASGSKLHKMREAIRPKNFVPGEAVSLEQQRHHQEFIGSIIWDQIRGHPLQVFVVEHDWASAFASAGEEVAGHEYRLPFDICLFEFQVSGRRLGIVAFQRHADRYELHGIVEVPEAGGWAYLGLNGPYQVAVRALVERQVRAVCIALEAEVAETEVIRVPHRLKMARERRGNPPMSDYRVVRLAHRSRVAPLPASNDDDEKRKSPRLHFRRGHWAHFTNHRTWRRWTLVGDPDLGFIDKHYRL